MSKIRQASLKNFLWSDKYSKQLTTSNLSIERSSKGRISSWTEAVRFLSFIKKLNNPNLLGTRKNNLWILDLKALKKGKPKPIAAFLELLKFGHKVWIFF